MDKLTVITTTISNMFEIRINEPHKTFEVFLRHPEKTQSIPARASAMLAQEIDNLVEQGYMRA